MYAHRYQNLTILLTAAYTSAKLCANFYDAILFISLVTVNVKHRAFSYVLQGSEVLDPVMTRRQSSNSAHPSPSSLDKMELEKLYGRLVLCSHSPGEPSVSPALFPAPFFPRSDMFRGPPPSLPLAENWVGACGQSYQSPMSL